MYEPLGLPHVYPLVSRLHFFIIILHINVIKSNRINLRLDTRLGDMWEYAFAAPKKRKASYPYGKIQGFYGPILSKIFKNKFCTNFSSFFLFFRDLKWQTSLISFVDQAVDDTFRNPFQILYI